MNPRDFCKVAQQLAGGTDPAELRTAAGRAYYALFSVGAELIDPVVPVNEGPAGHGQVKRLLLGCSDPDVKKVGSELGTLHSRRIDADYKLGNRAVENQKTVQALVVTAQKMIGKIDAAFTGPNAKAVMKSIQDNWVNVEKGQLRGRQRIV